MLAIASGLLLLSFQPAHAFAPPQKKLIESGWERTGTGDLLKYQKQMEETPYDGVVIYLRGNDDAGKLVTLGYKVFAPSPLKLSWFKDDIKNLQSFHSKQLTDNFAVITVKGNPPDWFDDKGWATIIDNWKVAATIAKEGGLKGLFFDPEMYSGATLFTYQAQPGAKQHSFAEYCAKVRQRGKQIIAAIAQIDPDMVFFTTRMNDINSSYADGGLEGSSYSLLPAFINGWLDAAPPQMTFVEGGESAYYFSQPAQYLHLANWIRNTGLVFVAPENRRKYRAQVQVSFGMYLDIYSYYHQSNVPEKYKRRAAQPLDGSVLNRLDSNINAAVNAADEYVWTWDEHYHWWTTTNKSAGDKTWEEVLPGTSNVLLNATHPQRAAAERDAKIDALLQQKKIQNLLQNPKFTETTTNPKIPKNWNTWKGLDKEGKTRPGVLDVQTNANGGNAVCIAGVPREGNFAQGIAVKPGERYYIRTFGSQWGNGNSWLDVRWSSDKGWIDRNKNQRTVAKKTKDGGPFELTLVVTVPPDATKMVVILEGGNQLTPGDKVCYSRAGVFRLPLK